MAISTDYVNALGAGSGLDTKKIVSAMVTSEKASSQSSIDRRTVDVESKISSMAKVKSALTNLNDAFTKLDDKDDFNLSALSNSDPNTVYAQFDGSVTTPGAYSLTVNQLAKGEIRQSQTYASATTDVASGAAHSFTLQTGNGVVHTVDLAAGNVSLTSVASAINTLDAGVSAWVVETSSGSFQLLVQGVSGADNGITIGDSGDLLGLNVANNKVQAAQNSEATMNGVSVSRSTNVISDLIPGVSLELSKTNATPVVVAITQDSSAAQLAITQMVDAYNEFEKTMKDLTGAINSEGQTGLLKSDSAIKGIQQTMRNFMTGVSSTPGAAYSSLTDIGIELQRSGEFKVDTQKLVTAIKSNYGEVTKMFSANTNNESPYGDKSRGIAGDLVTQISDYLSSSGIITQRNSTYTKTQTGLEDSQTALDLRMEKVEARYTSQFTTMNRIMDEMKSTQDYLESQLENLPFTSDNN